MQSPGDQRLEGVELQLAGFHGHGDGGIVTYHFKADLVHYLGNHGIHLAGHDG